MSHTDHAHELEERIRPALTKEKFFAKARAMSRYLDHTKKHTEGQIKRAWWWRELTQS